MMLMSRVSCVRFSPNPVIPVIVSAGWDKVVKVSLCPFLFSHPSPPRCDVTTYICYFRGSPMRPTISPRSLISYQSFLIHDCYACAEQC